MPRLEERVTRAIDERIFPGCVIGIVGCGDLVALPFGQLTYEDSEAVTADTVYDCASITKSIPTALLALRLIDEGRISLDDALLTYIPEYRTAYRDEVRIRHLLTYTLGNRVPLSSLASRTAAAIFEAVCTEDTMRPGMRFSYSNTPAFLLGIVIERLYAEPLHMVAQKHVFMPLRMHDTNFFPTVADMQIAPTEMNGEIGEIRGVVHDESARVFSRAHRAVGHAGLFSTAPDLMRFLEHTLAHPDERLSTNAIPEIGAFVSYGFELDQPWMGDARSRRAFGKTGFTGTSIMCDPQQGIGIVILSNRTYPRRPRDARAINLFRKDVCDIVFSI